MAEASQRNTSAARRVVGVLSAFLVLGLLATPASAGLPQRLDAAKARFAQLQKEIEQQQHVLDQLTAESAALWEKEQEAQAQYDLISEQLNQTRGELDVARQQYEDLQTQLNDRLRETYMNGPASSLEFVLGAESWTDLSDRMEYVNALAQTDNDLAAQVQNLRNDLAAKAHAQARLQVKQAAFLQQVQQDHADVEAKLAEQKKVFDDIQAKKSAARDVVHKLGKQYQHFLRTLNSVSVASSGVFRVCPVDQPRAVYDGFGAPRYAGGYHPHAGNDILAPLGTPIRAPFDGVASGGSNTLGGNSVVVTGSQGFVYNAHLSQPSTASGFVQAGQIIGYVGNTGDAVGGPTHDHFEWHPNVTPSPGSWPSSPYGYSVIDTGYGKPAVNPYPLLSQVC
ncbi:MAG: murein hydrolase activator EnvC family protein [Actinomycetota bacterium]